MSFCKAGNSMTPLGGQPAPVQAGGVAPSTAWILAVVIARRDEQRRGPAQLAEVESLSEDEVRALLAQEQDRPAGN